MARKSTCVKCGDEFEKWLAETNVDNIYGNGRYNWICNFVGGSLCANCAISDLYMEDEYGNEVPPENIIYPGLND